jgi:hypothetical protein
VPLAPAHEAGVDAEGDVVEEETAADAAGVDAALDGVGERGKRGERVVAVEPDVPSEMVPGPKRDADEGGAGLESDRSDRGERAVSTRHAEDLGIRAPGNVAWILALRQDVHVDAAFTRRGGKRFGSRLPVPRSRVYYQ